MTYDLWYWSGIPGRGEFVRLALEAGAIPYRDRNREAEEPDQALMADMKAWGDSPPFAPPYLLAGDLVIGQTATILMFLGERHGLAPADDAGRLWVNQVQLTIADMVLEAHDTHHPIDLNAVYEVQKPEAKRRAEAFRKDRMPKFLDWFERVLSARGDWLAGGERWSYADLSLFQLVEGLRHAFPRRMKTLEADRPHVVDLARRVGALPELADYLSSKRRLAFGDGLFRAYPELDGD